MTDICRWSLGMLAVMVVGGASSLTAASCPEDLTEDGQVGGADLGTLLAAWGECPDPGDCPEDLTGDGHVGGADLGTLLAAWGDCPDDFCPDGAIPEGEPCGEDETGGCAMDSPQFGPELECGDSVCGTAWAELQDPDDPDTGLRDTDWYPFSISGEQTEVAWSIDAAFEAVIMIIDANEGCVDDLNVIATSQGETATVEACLPPGDYWLFVAPAFFDGMPCEEGDNHYVASFETCTADPDGQGLCPEPLSNCCEPEPDQVGCEIDSCEQAVCDVDPGCCFEWDSGCAQLAEEHCGDLCTPAPPECGSGAGDCCSANGTPGCNDEACCQAVCECDPFCCDDEWDEMCAGQGLTGDCGAAVLCTECQDDPCPVDCPPDGIQEPEPCGQAVNDGCNMDDPAFTSIQDGQTVCGTVWAENDLRDTDWYEITVDEQSTITWEAESPFESVLFIAGGTCENLDTIASSIGECANSVEATVEAGTYWLIVAPLHFEGLPCSSQLNNYTATVSVEDGGDPPGESCGAPGTGDCCSATGSRYCDDAACCEAVCACDPFCCIVEWDELCAGPNIDVPGCSAKALCDHCD